MKFKFSIDLFKKVCNTLNFINYLNWEDKGLLKLMLDDDRKEKVSYEEVMKILNS